MVPSSYGHCLPVAMNAVQKTELLSFEASCLQEMRTWALRSEEQSFWVHCLLERTPDQSFEAQN